MLLGLACGNAFLDIGDQSTTGALYSVSPEVVNIAKQAFYDFGERPIWAERVTYGTSKSTSFLLIDLFLISLGDTSGSAIFSGRREGFAIYFARLVRPIWKAKVTKSGFVHFINSHLHIRPLL